MRQVTLYVIYKNEEWYRQIVAALGYDCRLEDYLNDIKRMGISCGDVALSALSDAFKRPIYCYNSFLNYANGSFFFDDCDFETLQGMFATRKQGTWQHNIFTPAVATTDNNHSRKPLKILFTTNHFTALLNSIEHEDIIPQTNNLNITDVVREE